MAVPLDMCVADVTWPWCKGDSVREAFWRAPGQALQEEEVVLPYRLLCVGMVVQLTAPTRGQGGSYTGMPLTSPAVSLGPTV